MNVTQLILLKLSSSLVMVFIEMPISITIHFCGLLCIFISEDLFFYKQTWHWKSFTCYFFVSVVPVSTKPFVYLSMLDFATCFVLLLQLYLLSLPLLYRNLFKFSLQFGLLPTYVAPETLYSHCFNGSHIKVWGFIPQALVYWSIFLLAYTSFRGY